MSARLPARLTRAAATKIVAADLADEVVRQRDEIARLTGLCQAEYAARHDAQALMLQVRAERDALGVQLALADAVVLAAEDWIAHEEPESPALATHVAGALAAFRAVRR